MKQFMIDPAGQEIKARLQEKIDLKTKPLGSLGTLESLALQVGMIQCTLSPALKNPHVLVFAGDHGIARAGVSAYPPEVTWQMVFNFLSGGAAINVFCKQNDLRLSIVDAGVNYDFPPDASGLIHAKIAKGTASFLDGPAMSEEQAALAIERGAGIVDEIYHAGSNVVGFGEMGIGNTSSASVIAGVLCGVLVKEVTGRGTGVDEEAFYRKISLLEKAIDRNGKPATPLAVLATYGGFEIAQMVGGMLQAAENRMLILVDGFISTAAFLVAHAMHPLVKEYAVFCHQSDERGHRRVLEYLSVEPLLKLNLRLGEGTGVAIAYPVIQAAVNFLTQMASFESAGVSTGATDRPGVSASAVDRSETRNPPGLSSIKITFLILWMLLWAANTTRAQALSDTERQTLAREIEQSFQQQLLSRWYPLAIDREKGGFLTSFTYDWKPTGNQDKMIVTQARHTWLPSKAAQLYPDKPYLREAARHGFIFLRDAMWDRPQGGFYTWVTREGKPKNPEDLKTAYGNAFGIYALAAYYQLSGDTTALGLAKRAFYWLEAHSHDPVHKGYFQNLKRDGTPAHLGKSTGARADLGGELSYKDQNSSIHLLEAFTELYAVWPDSLLRTRLEEMLILIRDTIVTNKGYLTLFLTPDWRPISYRDSTEATRKAHEAIDHVSFGHDIETAYLMLQAAHALELERDALTPAIAKKMVNHTLRNGWDGTNGGIYDRGYYYRDKNEITILSEHKVWWAEAEAMNTLLRMADQYPNDPMRYGEKFKQQWTYIQQYLIDPTYGGWYEGGLDKEPERKTGLKAHAWKAAYHDGRTLMNCLQFLRPDTIAPSPATQLVFSYDKQVLQWNEGSDNSRVQGYDIYLNGKRIGFTPLTSFRLPETKLTKGAVLTVVARDGQENKSKSATITY